MTEMRPVNTTRHFPNGIPAGTRFECVEQDGDLVAIPSEATPPGKAVARSIAAGDIVAVTALYPDWPALSGGPERESKAARLSRIASYCEKVESHEGLAGAAARDMAEDLAGGCVACGSREELHLIPERWGIALERPETIGKHLCEGCKWSALGPVVAAHDARRKP